MSTPPSDRAARAEREHELRMIRTQIELWVPIRVQAPVLAAFDQLAASLREDTGRFQGRPAYDPHFGDNRACVCGHPYYRHFDTYDSMEPVGCKYCSYEDCPEFRPATPSPDSGQPSGTAGGIASSLASAEEYDRQAEEARDSAPRSPDVMEGGAGGRCPKCGNTGVAPHPGGCWYTPCPRCGRIGDVNDPASRQVETAGDEPLRRLRHYLVSRGIDVSALDRLTEERDKMRMALSEAAQEINCAGPVAHRIRVLKRQHAEDLERLARLPSTEDGERERLSCPNCGVRMVYHTGDDEWPSIGYRCPSCGYDRERSDAEEVRAAIEFTIYAGYQRRAEALVALDRLARLPSTEDGERERQAEILKDCIAQFNPGTNPVPIPLATLRKTIEVLARSTPVQPAGERDTELSGGEWQPFDSAPTDGTEVMLYDADCGEMYLAEFTSRRGWRMDGGGPIGDATHWRPLPPPPDSIPSDGERSGG